MHEYLQALILALVQGLSEFIPVSSSGHLIIFEEILGSSFGGIVFDVVLHFGTLLSLLVYFRKDLLRFIASAYDPNSKDRRLAINLVIATIPAAIAGFFLFDITEKLMRSLWLVVFMLVFLSILMFVADRVKGSRDVDDITTKDALIIGFAQALSLIPGTSRAGSTIVAGSLLGLNNAESARFSFLMAIPILIGANVRVLSSEGSIAVVIEHLDSYILGLIVSFVVGYMVIKFLLSYLSNHSLAVFAWYRIILAVVIVGVLII
ncbi:MAG: undecaprenyl-diphosphatase UppP [Candidatus Saccharimonadales bacterium]